MLYDKLERTWNNQRVMWIRRVSSARFAKYSIEKRETGNKLVYNMRNGYYDKNGRNIRETYVDIVPVLEKLDENRQPILDTWEHFPDTKESEEFKNYIHFEGYKQPSEEDL